MMFYLSVFYLTVLNQVVGQYKMWNDVIFWFSQTIFYKHQEQYVLTTVKEMRYSGENAGKQCVTMSLLLFIIT